MLYFSLGVRLLRLAQRLRGIPPQGKNATKWREKTADWKLKYASHGLLWWRKTLLKVNTFSNQNKFCHKSKTLWLIFKKSPKSQNLFHEIKVTSIPSYLRQSLHAELSSFSWELTSFPNKISFVAKAKHFDFIFKKISIES